MIPLVIIFHSAHYIMGKQRPLLVVGYDKSSVYSYLVAIICKTGTRGAVTAVKSLYVTSTYPVPRRLNASSHIFRLLAIFKTQRGGIILGKQDYFYLNRAEQTDGQVQYGYIGAVTHSSAASARAGCVYFPELFASEVRGLRLLPGAARIGDPWAASISRSRSHRRAVGCASDPDGGAQSPAGTLHRLGSVAVTNLHQEVVDSVRSVAPVSAVRPSAAVVSSPDGQSAESSPDRLDRVIALLERVLEQQPRQHKLPYKSNVHTQRNLPMRSKPVVPCAVCSDEGHTTQYHCRSNHLCFNCFAPDHTRAECPGAVATKLRGAEPVRPQEN
ncbi:uncharacterized protein LOC118563230 isoform X2 [Fundulus heteroclitus]|uniref:uncharacterized protein LOC118563230 isoform X2 n=1 Tax=Fundulus heteroclitus TaxID=8078 RepID=UPI00165B2D80|nr:uncharacterized protein LOC118563230 isoform X2 [Fundulus heteroclitus]